MERVGVGFQPFLLACSTSVSEQMQREQDPRSEAVLLGATSARCSHIAVRGYTRASAPRKVCPAAGTMDHEPPEASVVAQRLSAHAR